MKIDITDSLKLQNLELHPLVLSYDGRKYTIPPDTEAIVPFPLVQTWFGDPRSGVTGYYFEKGGRKNFIESREKEIDRLTTLYGVNDDTPTLEERIPKVKITTVEGMTVHTPSEDPEGLHSAEAESDPETINDVTTLIRRHEALLNDLRERQTTLEKVAESSSIVKEVDSDEPNAIVARKRRVVS